jgi:glycosyltransferase involved in cell wall biosynthesis
MRYLFVHQNFPGQFKYLAPALSKIDGNEVIGFSMNEVAGTDSLRVISYKVTRSNSSGIHPLLKDFETKVLRGEAAYRAAVALKQEGFYPDVIIAHPSWGESLFLKEVWPNAKLGIYCEYFYKAQGADFGFDAEFSSIKNDSEISIKLKNINNYMHFDFAYTGISPTLWQRNTYPQSFQSRISVIHDGIDTDIAVSDSDAYVTINNVIKLNKSNEIITFVNRNLEPYRGYHIFMRSLPALLKERPNAHVIIVGGDKVSYGAAAPAGQSWKAIFLNEVIDRIDKSRVHFVGNLSYRNFIKVLQVSTVHVYLTYPFVLSWSLLEAMSVECAIVASKTAPVEEVIGHGINGMLVDFFDKELLTQEIIKLLDNPKLRAELGRAARNTILAKYDLKSICLPAQLAWSNALSNQ